MTATKTDPLAPAKRLLAELHAETQHEEKRLVLMKTDGADHFHQRIQGALATLTEGGLDSFTREAGALAAMAEGRRL